MKVKHDFITNSSSTGFIFITKTRNKSKFFEALVSHKECFALVHDSSWSSNPHINRYDVFDVIEELEYFIDKTQDPDARTGRFRTLASRIKEEQSDLKRYKDIRDKEREDNKLNPNVKHSSYDMWAEIVMEGEETIRRLTEAKNNGFTHIFEIDFGDNDGHISGSGIGSAMDYEGRNIEIQSDNLIVFTEQHR